MFSANQIEDSNNAVLGRGFVNVSTRIHEHHFVTIGTEKEASIICTTRGLCYCEKSGKLVYNKSKYPIKYLALQSPDGHM
ncbi:MAG TPA: hypothetical protein VE619_01705 [Nitrososphaeraceae archaeon]|nr:hypothetical protein [Nitrososphaeraceae archaeon]